MPSDYYAKYKRKKKELQEVKSSVEKVVIKLEVSRSVLTSPSLSYAPSFKTPSVRLLETEVELFVDQLLKIGQEKDAQISTLQEQISKAGSLSQQTQQRAFQMGYQQGYQQAYSAVHQLPQIMHQPQQPLQVPPQPHRPSKLKPQQTTPIAKKKKSDTPHLVSVKREKVLIKQEDPDNVTARRMRKPGEHIMLA